MREPAEVGGRGEKEAEAAEAANLGEMGSGCVASYLEIGGARPPVIGERVANLR